MPQTLNCGSGCHKTPLGDRGVDDNQNMSDAERLEDVRSKGPVEANGRCFISSATPTAEGRCHNFNGARIPEIGTPGCGNQPRLSGRLKAIKPIHLCLGAIQMGVGAWDLGSKDKASRVPPTNGASSDEGFVRVPHLRRWSNSIAILQWLSKVLVARGPKFGAS